MPNGLYIAGIEQLVVSEMVVPEARVNDPFSLTNDHARVAALLSPGFRQQVGQFETDFLTGQATLVAYWLPQFRSSLAPGDLHQSLLAWLFLVRRLFQALWLVKDNSACMELGYVEYPHMGVPAVIWRNFWQGIISKADTTREPTGFSGDELQRALKIFEKVTGRLQDELTAGRPTLSRWNTALYFLDSARIASHPGVKIAHYCTCLEALFASDPQELSHKLSERVAYFLETAPNERRRVFGELKAAYTLRSHIVHGNKKAVEEGHKARDVAILCDQALRRVLLRILDEPALTKRFIEGHDKDHEEYFNALVLGG